MAKKTKYCLNYAKGKHLNDGKSPSSMHCSGCYEEVKKRYETIQKNGGPIVGLRAARTLTGGSFGYETNKGEKERNLRAFFHYVMPHIPTAQAEQYVKDIAKSHSIELQAQDGSYKTVSIYKDNH